MRLSACAAALAVTLIRVPAAFSGTPHHPEEGAPKIRPAALPAASSSQAPPARVRAALAPAPSATFGGNPYVVLNNAAPSAYNREVEQHIAVDPTNPNNLVATAFTYAISGDAQNVAAVSFDGGQTWTGSQGPHNSRNLPLTGDGRTWQVSGDPVLAIDRAGNVYLVAIYFNRKNNANGLYVSRANLGAGTSFAFTAENTPPVATNTKGNSKIFEDKPWIAVDNSGGPRDGTVYVAWARFTGNSPAIVLSRSTDRGRTWSAALSVSAPSQGGNVQGAQVAVGPGGEVYVVYRAYDPSTSTFQHYLATSLDGATFSPPAPISPSFIGLTFPSPYRRLSFPALSVSPLRGPGGEVSLYVAWPTSSDDVVGAEVYLIASHDGGQTWTAPVALNDVSDGQQFMPGIAVDDAGVVHVSWFDTRHTPTDPSRWDIYATYSADGGLTWAPNAKVNFVQAACDPTSDFIGDYTGIAALGGRAFPAWTSGGVFAPAFYGTLQTAILAY